MNALDGSANVRTGLRQPERLYQEGYRDQRVCGGCEVVTSSSNKQTAVRVSRRDGGCDEAAERTKCCSWSVHTPVFHCPEHDGGTAIGEEPPARSATSISSTQTSSAVTLSFTLSSPTASS
ncbi:hypothetical protein J6590_068626 [Homalodisca vitripennis]|nr:hypothetical protein J6590_068626 [Homalodisca vitripennis]